MKIIEDFLKLDIEINGEIYELNVSKDLNMANIDNGINTTATKIAFMRKLAAEYEIKHDKAQNELIEYIAIQDKFVRARLFRGEEKILREIQRKKGWHEINNKILKYKKLMLITQGYLSSLYAFQKLLEIKNSRNTSNGDSRIRDFSIEKKE